MKKFLAVALLCVFTQLFGWSQPLSGNYTIGGISPSFGTFAAALQQLDSFGVAGPVTFLIRNGTYNEPLFVDSVAGASEINTITFRSESGDSSAVVLSWTTTATYPNGIFFNRASFMRFHQLTVRQLPSVHNSAVVRLVRGRNMTFTNCVFWGHASSTSSGTDDVFAGVCDSLLTIENCVLRGARVGLTAINSFFTHQKLSVKNNQIFGVIEDCIYMTGGAFADIRNNRIDQGAGSTSAGIYVSGHSRGTIWGNRINILNGAQGTVGMRLLSSSGFPNREFLVVNNEISFEAGGAATAYGISANFCNYFLFAHNSIRMSGGVFSAALQLLVTSYFRVLNNVLVHDSVGTTNYAVDIGINNNNFTSNYNNLYSRGPFLAPNRANLSAYQALGRDSNSISIPPQFTSTSLLYPNAAALFDFAPTLPDVQTDLTGWPRSSPLCDLGAYEQLGPPSVQLGNDTSVCDSFRLQTPTLPATSWLWSNGDTSTSIVVRTSGLYWLQATNAFGSRRDSILVSILGRPSVQLNVVNDSLCTGNCKQLSATVSGGSGNYRYQWLPTLGLSNDTIANPLACPSQSTTYTLVLTDQNGCQSPTVAASITVLPVPGVTINGTTAACEGDSLLLSGSSSLAGTSYRWEPAAWFSQPNQPQSTVVAPAGIQQVRLIGSSASGCTDTATVVLNVFPKPARPTIVSNGNTLTSSLASAYQWYFNSTPLAGANSRSLVITQNGSYRVAITDSQGCRNQSAELEIIGLSAMQQAFEQVHIYPNPFNEFLILSLPSTTDVNYAIYDLQGRRIMAGVCNALGENRIDLNSLDSGVYLLSLQLGQQMMHSRIVRE